MIALLLAGLLGAADPCAPVAVDAAPDPAAAEAYRAVAAEEEARGPREAAVVAWRRAAALDAADPTAPAALARLCAAGVPPDALAEGIRRMDAGDCRGALAAFAEARARGGGGASLDLVEGICRHALGDDRAAAPLLRAAERDPAHRAAARLYLGLVALRAGEAREATALLEDAAGTPALSRVAAELARAARLEAPLVLSFVVESGWDSNVTLAPAPAGADADATVALAAGALWRPQGAGGLYLRAAGRLHEQARLGAYDLGAGDVAAGWQQRGRLGGGRLELGAGARSLGGEPYLSTQQVVAAGWLGLGAHGLAATALVRRSDYAALYEGSSGVAVRGEARALLAVGGRARLALGYGLGRDAADAEALATVEHGPRAELRLLLGARTRLLADAALTFRRFDAPDPVLLAYRDDVALDGSVAVEWELSRGWTARGGVAARRAFADVEALAYTKVVPTVALAWTGP